MTTRGMGSEPRAWSAPVRLVPEQGETVESLAIRCAAVRVFDQAEQFLQDLAEIHFPTARDDKRRRAFIQRGLAQGVRWGNWFHFPESGELIRYPVAEDHALARTTRNRNLVTAVDQQRLRRCTIAFFGLSVGSAIAEQFSQTALGKHFVLADPDRVSATNLNRLSCDPSWLGALKVDMVATRLTRRDPYLQVTLLPDGYQSEQGADAWRLVDLIVEEMDDLGAKAHARELARELRVPLLMAADAGETSVVNVERHDLETVRPFNGLVPGRLHARLLDGTSTPAQQERALVGPVGGYLRLDPRLVRSALAAGHTTTGLPQLGSTARLGACLLDLVARDILLGRPVPSGSYRVDPRRLLKLPNPFTRRERVAALWAAASRRPA